MPLAHPHISPSVRGLYPATLVGGLGQGIDQVKHHLRLGVEQLRPSPGQALQATIDLPPGSWVIWPQHGRAAWLSRRPGPLPRVEDAARLIELDLVEAVRRLHHHRLVCVEVQLLVDGEWSEPLDAFEGLTRLVAEGGRVDAISGIFTGDQERPTRAELYRDGRVLAAEALQAERWLLLAHGMSDEL